MSNLLANSKAVSNGEIIDKIDRNFGHKKTCERQVNLTNTDLSGGAEETRTLTPRGAGT